MTYKRKEPRTLSLTVRGDVVWLRKWGIPRRGRRTCVVRFEVDGVQFEAKLRAAIVNHLIVETAVLRGTKREASP